MRMTLKKVVYSGFQTSHDDLECRPPLKEDLNTSMPQHKQEEK